MIIPLIVFGMIRCSALPVLLISLCLNGCDQTSDAYLPLGDDRTREYAVQLIINQTTRQQKIIVSDNPSIHIKDQLFFPKTSANGIIHYFYQDKQGIFSTRDPEKNGVFLMPTTPEPGYRWQSPTEIYLLNNRHETFAGDETFISVEESIILNHSIINLDDVVQVPAGKFNRCLKIESSGSVAVEARTSGIEQIIIHQTEWYAHGTGLIKRIREESTVPDKIYSKLVQELAVVR